MVSDFPLPDEEVVPVAFVPFVSEGISAKDLFAD